MINVTGISKLTQEKLLYKRILNEKVKMLFPKNQYAKHKKTKEKEELPPRIVRSNSNKINTE